MWNIDEVIFLEILKNSNLRHTYDNKDAIFLYKLFEFSLLVHKQEGIFVSLF